MRQPIETDTTLRLRLVMAGLAMAAPLVAVLATRRSWLADLPAAVAFHWDASGRADGTIATEPLSQVAIGFTALGLAVGLVLLLLPRMPLKDRRDYLFWTGSVAGLAAAAWLVPAGLAHHAGGAGAGSAELGGWIAALAASTLYGVVPYALVPRRRDERTRS